MQAVLAQGPQLAFLNHNQPVADAHNCYPYEGRWADRIERALSVGYPVAIEQDLAWYVDPPTGKGRIAVSHSAQPTGIEPGLRDYFFERVRPIIESALKKNDRATWPIIILHFDFKDQAEPLLRAVWDLVGEYESWITTAPKTGDDHSLATFDAKPLLVLTEDSDAQEQVFCRRLPIGGKLRIFGSAHTDPLPSQDPEERIHLAATLSPAKLLSERPTNYRRWWNNSWYEVEEGGQRKAGDWTAADAQRLRALVDHAHSLGFWIRFYTLDGFDPAGEDHGWGEGYNFGSASAVRARWQAAKDAGVDLIASDQYEELAAFLRGR